MHALITDYILDTAKTHDINHFEALPAEEELAVWADSAYHGKEHRKRVEANGTFFGVIHRRVRGQAELTEKQKAHNKLAVRHIPGGVRDAVCVDASGGPQVDAVPRATQDGDGLRALGGELQPLAGASA